MIEQSQEAEKKSERQREIESMTSKEKHALTQTP